ncbi:hypothetical protein, partial [Chitinophaga sp.]|uniref:hypothetical protein n=1 Tax=Chitinophaga sp. TaxID=1869181 RepID=UPI002BB8CF18
LSGIYLLMNTIKSIIKWCGRALIVFVILTAASYHNSMDNDGDLRFGFPMEIYHKAALVMFTATGKIGSSESFYPQHLAIDILFAFMVSIVLFFVYRRFIKRRKK